MDWKAPFRSNQGTFLSSWDKGSLQYLPAGISHLLSSSVRAREGAGCGSVGAVSGA